MAGEAVSICGLWPVPRFVFVFVVVSEVCADTQGNNHVRMASSHGCGGK